MLSSREEKKILFRGRERKRKWEIVKKIERIGEKERGGALLLFTFKNLSIINVK